MKRSIKIFLTILLAVVIFAVLPLIYNFIVLGQKDFGITKVYNYCENGVYSTYPRDITDSSTTYYNKNNEIIGQCHSWFPGDTCEPAKALAGSCKQQGFDSIISSPLRLVIWSLE